MSNFEMKDDTFTLFKNDKEGKELRPDYKGKIKINGKEMAIAAWIKEGKNGKYMSGKVSEFTPMPQETRDAFKQDDFDDDIPF